MEKLNFTTKPLSLSQRIELNDVTEYKTDGSEKFVTVKNLFRTQATAIKYGLKTFNGVEVTDKNVDEITNSLTNDEIKEIADQVSDETNFSKKKKS